MKKHHKAIMMVFASEDDELYRSLKKCWLTFCHKNPDIKVFFVYGQGSGLGKDSWDLCYEHLPENHRQGILKVIEAMEYIDHNYTCDYFIHTNLSTFWDFENLLKNLDQIEKPFVRGVPARIQKPSECIFLVGYSIIIDGKTFSRLVTYKEEMIKRHSSVKVERALAEDKILSIYLTGVFEMKYINSLRNQGSIKRFATNIDKPNIVELFRKRDIDHFRLKSSFDVKERLGVDDKNFNLLCEKYYGVSYTNSKNSSENTQ